MTRSSSSVATRNLATIIELLEAIELVEPACIPPVCRDPKDDIFLATAKAAQADYLVSEDADLTDLQEYEGIPIIDGRRFLEILESEAPPG